MTLATAPPAPCAMCHIFPNDPDLLEDWGDENAPGYWLCKDRRACLERAIAAQKAASDARLAELRRERDERIAARQKVADAAEAEATTQPAEAGAASDGEAAPAETGDVQAAAETAPEAETQP